MVYDVVIIGAGAAGFFAALAAGQRQRKTLLLEKSNKTGMKILMSGGSRCNLTQDTDRQGIVKAFGKNGKFLYSALANLGPSEIVNWFAEHGVPTKVEPTGKIFPVSDRAIDVRNALLSEVGKLVGVELKVATPVISVAREDDLFEVRTEKACYCSRSVIITTGGQSYPGCGTTGDGYQWAREFGHQIVSPIPALTPIVCSDQWVKDLKGITVTDVLLGVFGEEQVSRISEQNFDRLAMGSFRGSLLFTHFGLSGPAALNVSKQISSRVGQDAGTAEGAKSAASLRLVVDFLPDLTLANLESTLISGENRMKHPRTLVSQWLPGKLAHALVTKAGIRPDQNLAETSKKSVKLIISSLKQCEMRVEGTRGFHKAEVTSGGIALKEVNSHTMESKLCPGLYFAGEILDLDGPIGGYNFQSAFSTGFLAGMNV